MPDDLPDAMRDDVEISFIDVQPNPTALAGLCAAAIRSAMPLPKVGAEVVLDQARDAFIDLAAGKLSGKILLLP